MFSTLSPPKETPSWHCLRGSASLLSSGRLYGLKWKEKAVEEKELLKSSEEVPHRGTTARWIYHERRRAPRCMTSTLQCSKMSNCAQTCAKLILWRARDLGGHSTTEGAAPVHRISAVWKPVVRLVETVESSYRDDSWNQNACLQQPCSFYPSRASLI